MPRNRSKTLPSFSSVRKLIDFFDTHDMGRYWDRMREAHFDVNIKRRRYLVAIDEAIMVKLAEMARARKVSSQTLINSWLKEKLRKAG